VLGHIHAGNGGGGWTPASDVRGEERERVASNRRVPNVQAGYGTVW